MDEAFKGALLPVAAAAALGAGLLAVALHRSCTDCGYDLAGAQRDAVRLRRELTWSRQRVASLRSPAALMQRARLMGLTLDYPRRWNVVAAGDVLRVRHQSRVGAFAQVSAR